MYPNVRKVLETLLTSYELFQALKESLSEPEKEQLKEIQEIAEEELFENLQIMDNPQRKYKENYFNFQNAEQRSTFLLAFSDIVPREIILYEEFFKALDRVDAHYKHCEKS